MPSGPKKRRAAAKKKQQTEKVEDVISNQETIPVDNVVEDAVSNGVAEKAGSGCFSSALNEPVQSILNDIDHESNLSELLTSNELVKNCLHETNQAFEKAEYESLVLDNTADVMDREWNQNAEKGQSEMVASELLVMNEEVKHGADDFDDESDQTGAKGGSEMVFEVIESIQADVNAETGTVALDLMMNNEEVKHTTEDVDDESNQTGAKAGSEMVCEVIGSIQADVKAESETVASDLLMNNEEVKHITEDVDLESNQTVAKSGSEMVASVLSTTVNDPVMNTTNEVIESSQTADKLIYVMDTSHLLMNKEKVKRTTHVIGHESNQTVAKSGSELVASVLLTTGSNDSVMNTADEVIESIQAVDKAGLENASNEVTAKGTDDLSCIMQEMAKEVENPRDPNDSDTDYESLNKLKSDFQPLQEGVCGCTQCSLVHTLSEIKNVIKCCHLGETIGCSTQVKRVKEILEKELMATEKVRLVLKKALDHLCEATA